MFIKRGIVPYIFIFLLLLASSFAFASGTGDIAVVEGVIPITSSQLEEVMGKEGVYIFDTNLDSVRKESGTIPGALMLDYEKLAESLPKDKKASIIFYCTNRLCIDSSEIAREVQDMGYKNVFVLLDGIEGWVLSGREVSKYHITQWIDAPDMDNFTDNIHTGLMFGKIPACRDCHGTESTKIEVDKANTKITINTNCSSCHEKEQMAYSKSNHAESTTANMDGAILFGEKSDTKSIDNVEMNEEGKPKLKPDCWDCHTIHKAELYEKYNRKQLSTAKCAKCHTKEIETFENTFHGKALYLTSSDDMPTVTACYDCHTKHNIQKKDNLESSVGVALRVDTCKECHEKSNENFATFIGHPDPLNKDQNAVLYYVSMFFIILITCVFVFFGIHTILWWTRMLAMRMSNPKAWKAARDAAHHDKVAIKRFSLFHRFQHFFMAISFLGLSLTGLPQMFHDAPWAKTLASLFGGPIVLTQIHHVCAVILFLVFVSHVAEVSKVAWSRRDSIRNPKTGKLEFKRFLKAFFGPESLFPRIQDFKDAWAHIKWFLYMGPRPQFDRWTYWEKFDYLAEIWGMFTFGLTGLILWFPTTVGSIFPGWVINLSTVIHSYEALLAIGFIFAVHFFNTHFRVDRFPMDMVIFSGTITKEEMRQERKIWYDRLEKDGRLNELTDDPAKFKSYAIITKIIGFTMLGLGLLFLFLMIYTFIA